MITNENENNKIKLMLAIPSPRDIPEFHEEMTKIKNVDKYWVRYDHPTVKNLNKARTEFLKPENQQYTHFVIITDDTIVTQQHIDRLYDDLLFLENWKEGYSQQCCVGGYCNVDTKLWKDWANFCFYTVDIRPKKHNFRWVSLQQCRTAAVVAARTQGHSQMTFPFNNNNKKLVEVKHTGCTTFAIPRNILQVMSFRNDSYSGVDPRGFSEDVMTCYDIGNRMRKKLYIDLELEMRHLKKMDGIEKYFMVGIKEPDCYWERY
jgi:hypothetical protein